MGNLGVPRAAIPLHLSWVQEDLPGERWQALLERSWPSYRRWFLKKGSRSRPSYDTSRAQLEQHMPELVPIWERLCELAGDDPEVARMLSLYRPTPYVTGCSQAVWSRGEPMLVRNYDYHPDAFEGTFLCSRWSGHLTLVASDCLWGVLDGLNAHGLVVSLAFGGRREVGDGFGIPLILRYVLETCRNVAEAAEVLVRVPSHMSYNVSLLDVSGERVVAAVAPDRSTSILREDIATNHQRAFEWSRYDRFTRSAERERRLTELLADKSSSAQEFTRAFLRAPLYNTRYERAFGTLYTAVYRPADLSATYLWPAHTVEQSMNAFDPLELTVPLGLPR